MDVRIGVTYSPKEIDIDLGEEGDPADVKASVEAALGAGSVLWLTDRKGRQFGVPADKIAYVEVGGRDSSHRIGFGS